MLPVLDEEIVRHRIAKRIALDFEDGAVVNLGIGIPTLVSDYLPEGVHVMLQTENGVIGAGPETGGGRPSSYRGGRALPFASSRFVHRCQ